LGRVRVCSLGGNVVHETVRKSCSCSCVGARLTMLPFWLWASETEEEEAEFSVVLSLLRWSARGRGTYRVVSDQAACRPICSDIAATLTIDLKLVIHRTSDPSTSLQWWPAQMTRSAPSSRASTDTADSRDEASFSRNMFQLDSQL